MRNLPVLATIASLALLVAACGADDGSTLTGGPTPTGPGTGDPVDPTPPGPTGQDPATCAVGKSFLSFDGTSLTADRAKVGAGVDRGRVKPYDALAGEYQRVLGNVPASLTDAAPTFGSSEKRWYDEPGAGGVVLQTAYGVGFDGCLDYTATSVDFAAAPTAATATTKCTEMARKFWSRSATPDQVAACVDVAVTGAASEANPRRRWAYACASVIGSAGFLTY